MNKQHMTTIDGVAYDEHTGLKLESSGANPHHRQSTKSHAVHQKPSKSQTLSRRHVHAPAGHEKARKAAPRKPVVPLSPMISRFADIRPATKPHHEAPTMTDVAPVAHPLQRKVSPNVLTSVTKKKHIAASDLKHQAISKALQNTAPATHPPKRSFSRRHPRLVSVGSASLAIVLLAGYFTYINLPSISVRVAAAQAGIDASYPSYQPAGYGIRGPVAYTNGEVSINFQSNTNPSHFTINQSKTSWDSSALLENYVEPQADNIYNSYSDSGLTIYVYGTHAAWINGGILHTIDGDAELSGEQIRHIATSM